MGLNAATPSDNRYVDYGEIFSAFCLLLPNIYSFKTIKILEKSLKYVQT